MSEPLTLFYFADRTARLRDAQRACDRQASAYNLRQVEPLAGEVDSLIVRAGKLGLYPEFEQLVKQVREMRQAQGQYSDVTHEELSSLEKGVDKVLGLYAEQARCLNDQLRDHNTPLGMFVMTNNKPVQNEKRGVR